MIKISQTLLKAQKKIADNKQLEVRIKKAQAKI